MERTYVYSYFSALKSMQGLLYLLLILPLFYFVDYYFQVSSSLTYLLFLVVSIYFLPTLYLMVWYYRADANTKVLVAKEYIVVNDERISKSDVFKIVHYGVFRSNYQPYFSGFSYYTIYHVNGETIITNAVIPNEEVFGVFCNRKHTPYALPHLFGQ